MSAEAHRLAEALGGGCRGSGPIELIVLTVPEAQAVEARLAELERERDEARAERERWERAYEVTRGVEAHLRDSREQIIRERDEARAEVERSESLRDDALREVRELEEECRSRAAWAEQYLRERDEARQALSVSRDWGGGKLVETIRERDEARAEVERLRVQIEEAYEPSAAITAMLSAGNRVRGGFMYWLKGAPTHMLAELLNELRKDGWVLRRER